MDIISLIQKLASGLLEAEDRFMEHLDRFPELEETVTNLTNRMAADFLGAVLTEADDLIRDSGVRKKEYTIQRRRSRTLISSVGDITFTHTLYKDRNGRIRCLLDEQICLPERERFTTIAEAKVLQEAQVHSYQHAAESIRSGEQRITKTTVMNKIHAIEEDLSAVCREEDAEKKEAEYLYIEADEDHIHRQKDGTEGGCHIGKLVYLFEGKEDVCKGRRKLLEAVYFGGLYNGSEENGRLWREVEGYIRDHYDQDILKKVYISGDGGAWIRSGTEYVYKSVYVADRFHLMKYIYRAANYTLDEKEAVIGRFYRCIYKNRRKEAERLLDEIERYSAGSERAVQDCRSYLRNNWEAIQRAFHDEHVYGCSAEGHVSNVYSERMSSRPMGWSETGSDRMCRLRCFVKNHGNEKIIDLVRYRRRKEMGEVRATGTDGILDHGAVEKYSASQRRARSYIERIQATIPANATVRKTFAIRNQLII